MPRSPDHPCPQVPSSLPTCRPVAPPGLTRRWSARRERPISTTYHPRSDTDAAVARLARVAGAEKHAVAIPDAREGADAAFFVEARPVHRAIVIGLARDRAKPTGPLVARCKTALVALVRTVAAC